LAVHDDRVAARVQILEDVVSIRVRLGCLHYAGRFVLQLHRCARQQRPGVVRNLSRDSSSFRLRRCIPRRHCNQQRQQKSSKSPLHCCSLQKTSKTISPHVTAHPRRNVSSATCLAGVDRSESWGWEPWLPVQHYSCCDIYLSNRSNWVLINI